MNFRNLAATLSLARAIKPDKAAAFAVYDSQLDRVMVLTATRDHELAILQVSADTSVEEDALALNQRGLRALAYAAIPIAALWLGSGLDSANHALHQIDKRWIEEDEDQTITVLIRRLVADSDPLSLNDLSVDTDGVKWGMYIDPAKLTVAVHAIEENAGDPARGVLVFVMKSTSSELLRLTQRVIKDVRALDEIRAKERDSLQGFLGGLEIHIIDGHALFGGHGQGAREAAEAAI